MKWARLLWGSGCWIEKNSCDLRHRDNRGLGRDSYCLNEALQVAVPLCEDNLQRCSNCLAFRRGMIMIRIVLHNGSSLDGRLVWRWDHIRARHHR